MRSGRLKKPNTWTHGPNWTDITNVLILNDEVPDPPGDVARVRITVHIMIDTVGTISTIAKDAGGIWILDLRAR